MHVDDEEEPVIDLVRISDLLDDVTEYHDLTDRIGPSRLSRLILQFWQ